MSNGKLQAIHDRQVGDRHHSALYVGAFLVALVALALAYVYMVR